MKNLKTFTCVASFFLFFGTFFTDAYAYIDPGSGALFIQIIIGALVGASITLKLYWYKIKEKVTRSSKDDQK